MNSYKSSIFIWAPHTSKVGTVENIINCFHSINKYSNFNLNIINVFGEWNNYVEDLKLYNVKIHSFKFLKFLQNWDIKGFFKSRFCYLLIFLFSFFPLLNLIKKNKPNFLIVHLISSLPLLIFRIFNPKTKLILHIAGHPKLNFLRKMIWKISSKKIFKVICPSEELKFYLLENNIFKENQIEVIEDPHLVIKKINYLKKQTVEDDFFDDGKILIAVGRMTKQKNYKFLIENFTKLTSKYNDIKLVIIGDGEEKKHLKSLINNFDISGKIKLINHQNNIYKYLKKSNYYISTSSWEGSSLAMVDAAYIGLPILCSNCPTGRKEFIGKNERGFLYNQNDSEDFMNLFSKMYDLDKTDTYKLILKTKKFVKRFTLFKSFMKMNKILN